MVLWLFLDFLCHFTSSRIEKDSLLISYVHFLYLIISLKEINIVTLIDLFLWVDSAE